MDRRYVKRECEDCSWKMYHEVDEKILGQLRAILEVPEHKDIIHHATKLMKEYKERQANE